MSKSNLAEKLPAQSEQDLTPEYLDHLCKAGCDLISYEKNELKLTEDAKFKDSYISIAEAIRVFYALIWLEGRDKSMRLRSFQSFYNSKLTDALFDYCLGAIAGELRHAGDCIAGKRVNFKPDGILSPILKRNAAIDAALYLNPDSLLKVAIEVFGLDGWGGSYGGWSWFEISEVTAKISSITRLRWIDEIIHCRHCGGKLFDRHIVFESEDSKMYKARGKFLNFRQFLDYRREGFFDEDLEKTGFTFEELLTDYAQTIENVLNYKPVPFGFITLSANIKEDGKCSNDDDNNGDSKTNPNKTQKKIGKKPFQKITLYKNEHLKTLQIYVSDKYNSEEKESFLDYFTQAKHSNDWIKQKIKTYILWTYISKNKQYIRKSTFVAKSHSDFESKISHKLLHQILPKTNNVNNIKIYIDRI